MSTAHATQSSLGTDRSGNPVRVKVIAEAVPAQAMERIANPKATVRRPITFARLLRPRLRSRLTLIQSSSSPTSPAPMIASMSVMPLRVKIVSARRWLTM